MEALAKQYKILFNKVPPSATLKRKSPHVQRGIIELADGASIELEVRTNSENENWEISLSVVMNGRRLFRKTLLATVED